MSRWHTRALYLGSMHSLATLADLSIKRLSIFRRISAHTGPAGGDVNTKIVQKQLLSLS